MKQRSIKLNTLQKIASYLDTDLPRLSNRSTSPQEVFDFTKQLLAKLGNPEHGVPAIHVAGTSGKGTVSYMIDAMLRAHDKRTALCVTPHVYEVRERIQINGQLAPERQFIHMVNTVLTTARELSGGKGLNYFAILTVISLLGIGSQRLDYAVVEAGLGGTYELTNLIEPSNRVTVIAEVEAYADQAAAVMTNHSLVVALKQDEKASTVLQSQAQKTQSAIQWVQKAGVYQVDDLLLALNTVKCIAERDGWQFNEERAKVAADRAYIPGRYERRDVRGVLTMLDGAHSPHSLNALAHRLSADDYTPINILLALGHKKNIPQCLQMIKPICKNLYITEYFTKKGYRSRQAAPAREVARVAQQLGLRVAGHDPDAHLQFTRAVSSGEPLLVTGSFYLLSEVDRYF